MACRNDEPARSALAIRVIVSGSCLLKAFSRPPLRRLSQKRGMKKPMNPPIEPDERAAEGRDERRQKDHEERDAERRGGPDHQELGRLELEVGPGDLAREVGAEVALLDDPVQVRQRLALGDQVADRALPGASRPSSRLRGRGGVALESVGDAGAAGARDPDRDEQDGQRGDAGHREGQLAPWSVASSGA